jgi:hypothetical protein
VVHKKGEILNPESTTQYRLCALTKPHLLELKLDGVRFETVRDLSIFLEELNTRLLRAIDFREIVFKPKDYENTSHLYTFVIGRFRNLRRLALPVIEHKTHFGSPTGFSNRVVRDKLSKLEEIDFKLLAP